MNFYIAKENFSFLKIMYAIALLLGISILTKLHFSTLGVAYIYFVSLSSILFILACKLVFSMYKKNDIT